MIWSFVLAAVGTLGLYLAGKKNYWGWGIGFATQALWIIYGAVTAQYGFIFGAVAYAWVSAKNFLAWRRESAADLCLDEAPP